MKNTKTISEFKKMLENNNLFQILINNSKKSNKKGIQTMKSLRNSIAIAVFTISVIFTASASAQEDLNKTFAEMDARSFQPLTDAFSSSVNSGLYHSAKINKNFSMYIGIKGSTTEVI